MDIEGIFQIIIVLAVIVFWVVKNVFGAGAEDDEGATPPGAENDRTREIQEEIRRRIAERQRQREPQAPARQPAPAGRPSAYDPSRPEKQQPPVRQPEPSTFRRQVEPPQPLPEPQPAALDIQEQLEARMEQLRKTRERSKAMIREARSRTRRATGVRSRKGTAAFDRVRGDIASALEDPNSARKAFVYAEVLGPPVSQRRDGFMQHWRE